MVERDDVIARAGQPKDSEIVGLGAAAGKHDLRRTAPQQRRDRFARALDRRPRLLPMMMDGRRVAEMLAKVGPHGLENFRQNRSRRVIVEINPPHLCILRVIATVQRIGATGRLCV